MCCFLFPLVIDDLADNRYLLPSIRAADIVECVCMWMELSQNLQSVSPYYPCPPSVFVLPYYGKTSKIIESNKLMSASQPLLTNRYQ